MRRRTWSLGEPLTLEAERQLEPRGHVELFQQLDLLHERQVRGVARGVRKRARLGDRAHERRDPPVVAARLEDLVHDGAVLAHQLARAAVVRLGVRHLFDGHAQRARRVGLGCAGDAAMQAGERHRVAATGQPHVLVDLCDGPDRGELGVVPRDQQHLLLGRRDGDRERQGHMGEDDGVVQWDQEEL